jgi:predicted PurR-regulated permease PerM
MTNKKTWCYIIGIAFIVIVIKYSNNILGALQILLALISPLITGCAIAYVLNILMCKIENLPFLQKESSKIYKFKRPISIVSSIAIIIAIFVIIIKIVIPQLIDATEVLLAAIPKTVAQLVDWLSKQEFSLPQIETLLDSANLNWSQIFQKAVQYFTSGISSIFSSTFLILSSVGGVIMQFVIAFIFALYILSGREQLTNQVRSVAKAYLKKSWYDKISYVIETANDVFTKFIIGQCTEAVIIGLLCTAGMLLLRFPYATMIGTLVGATALLPVVGAYIGAFVGAFMIFTINPMQSIGFLIFIVILQQLEGNLIYPRVVGSSVGLPGIWVLAAVTVGGGIGGIVGMLLAVPITATFYKLLQKDVRKRLQKIEVSN